MRSDIRAFETQIMEIIEKSNGTIQLRLFELILNAYEKISNPDNIENSSKFNFKI